MNEKKDTLFSFPWSNSFGIAKAIDDPELWAFVLSASTIGKNSDEVRQDVKRIIKKYTSRSDGVISVNRDDSFGQALTHLMANPEGRSQLFAFLDERLTVSTGRQFVATQIYEFAKRVGTAPKFEEISEEREDKRAYLHIERFRDWFRVASFDGIGRCQAITLAACGFAVLQPELGADIYKILASSPKEFSSLINVDQSQALSKRKRTRPTLPEKKEGSPQTTLPVRKREGPPTGSQEMLSVKGNSECIAELFTTDSPSRLEQQIVAWGDAEQFGVMLSENQHGLAIERIKAVSRHLSLIAQELDSQQSQLALMKTRISESSIELARLPWFSTPIECLSATTVDTTLPLSSVMQRLTKDYELSTRLLDIHSRLCELYEALGRKVEPLPSACPSTIDDACEVLAEEAKTTETLIKAAASRESRVADFLESLSDSPLVETPSILAGISVDRCQDILSFVASDVTVSESGKRFASLKHNLELAGIVIGMLRENDADWLVCAKEAQVTLLVSDIYGFEKLCRFVDIGGMRDLCLEFPDLAPHFCALVAGIAIRESKPSALEYAADFIDLKVLTQRSERVLTLMLDLFRRGEFANALTVARLRDANKNTATKQVCREQKLRLKELITCPPGLRKTYHLLRVIAQASYLKPLEPFIDQDDPASAIAKWQSFGGLDEMVQATIRSSNKESEVEARHKLQTQNYLELFDEALKEWSALHQTVPAAVSQRLGSFLSALEAGNAADRELLHIVCGNAEHVSKALPCLRRLGEQLIPGRKDGALYLSTPEALVIALHQLSWPLVVSGRAVPFLTYSADWLSGVLVGFNSLTEVVSRYLSISEYRAAQEAARGDSDIAKRVDAVVESKKREILEQYAELLDEASIVSVEDGFVDLLLTETKDSIEELALEKLEENIEGLAQSLTECRSKKEPAYLQLLKFLEESQVTVAAGCTLSELEHYVATIKECERPRRKHLYTLLSLAESNPIAESSMARIKKLVETFDVPSRWPTGDHSQLLSEAVDRLEGYIANRLVYRERDNIAESVTRSIVVDVEACLSAFPDDAEEMVFRFSEKADKIASPGIPDDVVMQLIEEQAAISESWSTSQADDRPLKRTVLYQDTPLAIRTHTPRGSDATFSRTQELVARVRSSLRPLIQESATKTVMPIGATELGRAIRSERWTEAMRLAASLSADNYVNADPDCLSSSEVAFVVSRIMPVLSQHSREYSKEFLELACLAIACSDPTSYSHVLPSERISQVISKVFNLLITGQIKNTESDHHDWSEQITDTIAYLAAASDGNRAYVWVNNLFIEASDVKCGELDGGSLIADCLWNSVKGKGKSVPLARSELLNLLYRLRRLRAIENLIRHAAKPRRAEIRLCLQTIAKISSDPELSLNAHTKFNALQERSAGQPNTKPWLLFFGKVLAQDQRESEQLKCSVESDQVAFDDNDNGLIEVELTPDALDPPSELKLTLTSSQENNRITAEIQLPLDTEPLLKPKIFTISIPPVFLQNAGEVLRVSAHFTGVSASGRPVDLRVSWDLPFTAVRLQPIDTYLQSRSWPGATGDPVKKEGGFYGRDREFEELQSYINDNQRPRSVMVFGQRRIGKTSLLLEMVNLYPPSERRACGVFVDVAGLELSREESMQRALFSCIVSAIDSKSANAQLRGEIKRHSGENARLDRLAKSLTPDISIADALQELSNIVSRCTNGKVRRLAIFIDEFDRFVEPLLDGREDQVDRLMRGLREVVQTSETISLILAGSGLQRMLVDDYGYGFHGSIGELEIKPFELPADRRAIESTLLPSSIGNRLCPPDRRKQIVEHAQKLCGGHPYYLAMLGFAAAHVSRGHPLTPALMNRVVENMVRGKIPKHITSKKFYSHIFETLKRLPSQDQQVAKIVLSNIAATTTQELEWTTKREAIDVPELVGVELSKRYNILRALSDERAIISDEKNSTVKIRVPVTAAALREDSDKIRHEASVFLEAQ